MILYIVRHAWAEDRDEACWPDDGLRPLTKKGQKRFAKLMKRLTKRRFAPQQVATSPLVRCVQTAEILVEHLSKKTGIVELPALAPGSDLAALVKWTAEQAADEVAWVGHAPDVSRLLAELIGSKQADIAFAKGAVACIKFEVGIGTSQGELQWLATANLLGV